MNWRLATSINGIAAITLIAVAYDLSCERSREAVTKLDSPKNSAQGEARRKNRLLGPGDEITEMRVDDLAVVPPAELYDIFFRANPDQIAAIALKFNDRPTDSRSTGGILIFFQAWAELDPAQALQGAFRLKDAVERADALNVVAGSSSPGAAPELAKALADHPVDASLVIAKGRSLRGLVQKWAWVDPAAAARFLPTRRKGLDDQLLPTAGRQSLRRGPRSIRVLLSLGSTNGEDRIAPKSKYFSLRRSMDGFDPIQMRRRSISPSIPILQGLFRLLRR